MNYVVTSQQTGKYFDAIEHNTGPINNTLLNISRRSSTKVSDPDASAVGWRGDEGREIN